MIKPKTFNWIAISVVQINSTHRKYFNSIRLTCKSHNHILSSTMDVSLSLLLHRAVPTPNEVLHHESRQLFKKSDPSSIRGNALLFPDFLESTSTWSQRHIIAFHMLDFNDLLIDCLYPQLYYPFNWRPRHCWGGKTIHSLQRRCPARENRQGQNRPSVFILSNPSRLPTDTTEDSFAPASSYPSPTIFAVTSVNPSIQCIRQFRVLLFAIDRFCGRSCHESYEWR